MKTWVKICGLKTSQTMEAALDAGADYVGLVFVPKSPRNISLPDAAGLAALARDRASIVALTVDADDDALTSIIEHVAPDVLQLHGSETPQRVAAIRQRFGPKVWKAIPVSSAGDAALAFDYAGVADGILFDAKPPKGAALPGGNGLAFDWAALEGVRGKLDFMLSGGLDPQNVAAAIRATGAWGVDVSSGVESAPGVKDPALIGRFLRAVCEAGTTR